MNKNVNFCGCKNAIVLDRVEKYDASVLNCYAFRRGTDMVDGLSLALGNMVSGFPFDLEGIIFQKAGFIDKEGNESIPCIYDKVYPFKEISVN